MDNDKITYMKNYVTAEVISLLLEDSQLSEQEAMNAFYTSQVFDRLCDSETGLYRESGGYVYELYKVEKKHGQLIQTEV